MELGETQKSSAEAPKHLENDLKIKNLDVHETIEKETKIIDFPSSEGQLGAQICFQEAWKLRKKELEGTKSKLREKKSSKKREREREGAPKELGCHGSSALAIDYELRMSPLESRKSYQRAHEEILGSQHGARRDSKEFPRSSRELGKQT